MENVKVTVDLERHIKSIEIDRQKNTAEAMQNGHFFFKYVWESDEDVMNRFFGGADAQTSS